ncbi:Hypothetical predicted protein [Olea europaea subsp. europaea]|uniref:Uncharacterized protein n=1 Tax=Olea europaea subsp. europaea TaxID=158383 RepID=A0A8S0QVN6_OLEEU|nr:Hypothetical predicted protein [Olea europaea subsp. europaea]
MTGKLDRRQHLHGAGDDTTTNDELLFPLFAVDPKPSYNGDEVKMEVGDSNGGYSNGGNNTVFAMKKLDRRQHLHGAGDDTTTNDALLFPLFAVDPNPAIMEMKSKWKLATLMVATPTVATARVTD